MKNNKKYFQIIIITIICLFQFSCKTTDPLKIESQNSSINLALHFLEDFENPKTKKMLGDIYDRFSKNTKKQLTYDEFYNLIMSKFPNGQIFNRKLEISTWEKRDLNNETVLVYLLKKYNYKVLKRTYAKYALIRINVIKENNKWSIDLENPSTFKYFKIILEGIYIGLNKEELDRIKDAVKKDFETYKFKIDQQNMPDHEESLAINCIQIGEKLYDQEKYRPALMQFQKALSIDPLNEKALIYIKRCKKAISFGLTS